MTKKNHDNSSGKVPRPLKRLIEAHQMLADMESLEALLPCLLDLARNVANAEAASFLLYNRERRVLEFAAARDEILGEQAAQALKNSVELRIGEGIAGWVAKERKPIVVRDAQTDPRFSRQADKKTGFATRNLLCVPLLYGDELLGVINVLNSKDRPSFDSFDEELLECFADLASTAITRSRFLELRLKQERIQIQLEAAAKIQSLFWPRIPEMGKGSHVWGVSVPAAYVGGDAYDIIPMPDGSWLAYVADVSDKGFHAALIMASLSTKIRSAALMQVEVDKIMESVNKSMYDLMVEEGFFATIVLGKYWPDSGKMQLSIGGHLPPVMVTAGGMQNFPDFRGIALGVLPEADYEKREITLAPAESILFISDGLIEAENDDGDFFGMDRLENCILGSSGPPYGKGVQDMVNAWRGGAKARDDMTILEIWRDPA